MNEQVFHFRVEAANANTGRDTVIVGIITPGILRVGDSLDLHHAGSRRAVSYRGVEFVDDSAGDELISPSMSD